MTSATVSAGRARTTPATRTPAADAIAPSTRLASGLTPRNAIPQSAMPRPSSEYNDRSIWPNATAPRTTARIPVMANAQKVSTPTRPSTSEATASLFVPLRIAHPLWMVAFLILTTVSFSLLGFIIGIWADGFEKLQFVPMLVITPLTFLGGTFYSISVLPPFWQTVAHFNPIVYLISGFRWSFFEVADVSVGLSLGMTVLFLAICLVTIRRIFKTGYRLKN